MPKKPNQGLKILYLMKLLMDYTDENHGITTKEIIEHLDKYDISVERKTVYSDIELLIDYGIDILKEKRGKDMIYYVGSRHLEVPEVKLLIDAVQASKFITAKKSKDLIKKLENFMSVYEAKLLQREVYVSGRVKTDNESIFYSVDTIHEAIANDKMLLFNYFDWNIGKTKVLRRNGKKYEVSPFALIYSNANYYMIAFDNEAERLKHYRVDKMMKTSVSDKSRVGHKSFKKKAISDYTKKIFSMYDGEVESVNLEFKNEFAGVVIDQFGRDISFVKVDEEHFRVNVEVAISNQFLGWIFALGDGVKIIGPKKLLDIARSEVERLSKLYL